jgi:hypothetical protein
MLHQDIQESAPIVADQQFGITLPTQLGDHLVRQLPPVTLEPNDQFRPDSLEGSYRIVVVETTAWRQQRGNVFGLAAGQFLLGLRVRDGLAFESEVTIEAGHQLIGIHWINSPRVDMRQLLSLAQYYSRRPVFMSDEMFKLVI